MFKLIEFILGGGGREVQIQIVWLVMEYLGIQKAQGVIRETPDG